jgi:phosphate starvation-inducible protein PhoH
LRQQAHPKSLGEFLALFCAKLAARKQENKAAAAAAGGKAPILAPGTKGKENAVPWLQTAMRSKLYRPPDEVKEISPVNERERSICPVLKRSRDGCAADAGERALSPGKRHRLLDALDAEQREVLDAVLEGRNVFFTGKAGTGKSFLLRTLLQVIPVKGAAPFPFVCAPATCSSG